jgi:hypothetical protein
MCTLIFADAPARFDITILQTEPTVVMAYGPKGGRSSCVWMVLPAPPATYEHGPSE